MSELRLNPADLFSRLPPDLRTNVSQRLPFPQSFVLASTSRENTRLADDPDFWKRVDLSTRTVKGAVTDTVLRNVSLRAKGAIEHLDLSGRLPAEISDCVSPQDKETESVSITCLEEVIRANPRLQTLTLNDAEVEWWSDGRYLDEDDIEAILADAPRLARLDCDAHVLMENVPKLCSLAKVRVKRLSLRSVATEDVWKKTMAALQKYTFITDLAVQFDPHQNDWQPAEEQIAAVVALANGLNLASLCLVVDTTRHSFDDVWPHLTSLLRTNKKLRALKLEDVAEKPGMCPTREFTEAVRDSRPVSLTVKSMSFYERVNEDDDEEEEDDYLFPHERPPPQCAYPGISFVKALRKHPTLETIIFHSFVSSNPQNKLITQDVGFELALLIHANAPSLTTLVFNHCQIKNTFLILSLLEQNTHLVNLECTREDSSSSTFLTNGEDPFLEEVVEKNTSLRHLVLVGDRHTPRTQLEAQAERIEALVKARLNFRLNFRLRGAALRFGKV